MTVSWTDRLWAEAEGTYRAILGHPFLTGLTDGSLDEDRFAYYIAQDAYYLRDYARALAIVAAKAPTHADTGLFARHAAETVAVELALHETLLADLGLDPSRVERTPVSPTITAYTSYLLAATYGGTFAAGLATVLPCYWIYQRVGAALVAQGSPNPRYQQWINTYAGDAFAATVAKVLVVADRLVRRSIRPRIPMRAATSPRPRAMSGCSGTPPGDARPGPSDAGYPPSWVQVARSIRHQLGKLGHRRHQGRPPPTWCRGSPSAMAEPPRG